MKLLFLNKVYVDMINVRGK